MSISISGIDYFQSIGKTTKCTIVQQVSLDLGKPIKKYPAKSEFGKKASCAGNQCFSQGSIIKFDHDLASSNKCDCFSFSKNTTQSKYEVTPKQIF